MLSHTTVVHYNSMDGLLLMIEAIKRVNETSKFDRI